MVTRSKTNKLQGKVSNNVRQRKSSQKWRKKLLQEPYNKFLINLVYSICYWKVFAFGFSAQSSLLRRSICTDLAICIWRVKIILILCTLCSYFVPDSEPGKSMAVSSSLAFCCPELHRIRARLKYQAEKSTHLSFFPRRRGVREGYVHFGDIFLTTVPYGCKCKETSNVPWRS